MRNPGENVFIRNYPNGLTLLAEFMPDVSSAAVSVLIPAGAARDPEGEEGSASILSELMTKGAGKFGSRELSEAFESIGAHRGQSAGIEVSIFSCSLLGENLPQALRLIGAVIREPHLPAEELENVRQLALQELRSLEDEPSSLVMVELAKHFYPHPFGRCQLGTEEGLQKISIDSLRKFYESSFLPSNAIIAVAGKFDWAELEKVIEEQFGDWSGSQALIEPSPRRKDSSAHHMQRDTNQLQIALAYPSVPLEHPDYSAAKVAVGVLSGGMAGRLFIEVREKRGLVYRVSASHSAAKGRAAVFAYAGTTPENSEETLRTMITELRRLADGVTEDELKRSKADLKSRIVMQGELSSVRASALVNDYWHLGRVRSLAEVKAGIDRVTDEDIKRHLHEFPVQPITLVTLGPKSLELPQ